MISYNGRHVMIDSTPDFREQALREHITQLDAVLYTHTHADHILGIDDLRPLTIDHKPASCRFMPRREAASFCAKCSVTFLKPTYKFGGLPQVELHPIDGPVKLFGARFEPVTVIHGETPILGFRFGSAAYLTDHSEFRPKRWRNCGASTYCFWMRCATSLIPRIRQWRSRSRSWKR